MECAQMKIDDSILRECLFDSGVYNYKDIPEPDNIGYDNYTKLVLATALLDLRPDLKMEINKDIVFIVRRVNSDGHSVLSKPYNSLTGLFNDDTNNKPYDDCVIWSYSISEQAFVEKMLVGTGTNWERYK